MGLGRSFRALLLLTIAVAACRFDSGGAPGAADDGGARADANPLAPDAAIDASGTCDPASNQMCLDATMLRTCDGIEVCADGCEPRGARGAHCRGFHPHNGVDPAWLDDASVDLDIPGAKRLVFDSSTGVIFDCSTGLFVRDAGVGVQSGIRYERAAGQGGGVNLGVFVLKSLRLHAGGEIVVVGADGFGLLVDGELRLESVLRAGGGATRCSIEAACGVDQGVRICSGAGGGDGGEPNMNGQGVGGGGRGTGAPGSAVLETGGGGGGFGLSGGAGGGLGGGGPGGDYGEADCEPLIGGSGGGGGGFGTSGEPGLGGGGGGAVQLTSRTKIRIDGQGGVEVGGAGGGPSFGGDGSGAGGGGAGGMVLLEAPVIDLAGGIAANGGAGGGGDGGVNDGLLETEGSSGGFGGTPAPGGTGFYAGGNGGAGATAAEPGDPAGLSVDATGGGGGGVGRVCLRSVDGGISGTGMVSPAPGTSFDLID